MMFFSVKVSYSKIVTYMNQNFSQQESLYTKEREDKGTEENSWVFPYLSSISCNGIT